MLFHGSGIEVAPWIPPLIAFAISFFTSMGGVSGAFLLLPFQMSVLGYTSPSVSATNQVFNIIAIPSGVYRYWSEGRMVWPLTWVIILGTLPGVFIGAVVRVVYLPNPRHFKLFAASVLFFIAFKMIRDLLKYKKRECNKISDKKEFQALRESHQPRCNSSTTNNGETHLKATTVTHFNLKRIGYTFYDETFDVSFWGIFILSFVVGIAGGTYGIGGGAIIAPFLVTYFALPVYTVAGAALMGTFVTSVAGVIFYQIIALFYPNLSVAPDWFLGILFGIGGMAGMYLGARCQKFVSEKTIKWMLACIIITTAFKYTVDFLNN